MSKAQEKREAIEQAIVRLREMCPKGTKVWTVLRHVSPSGTSRRMDAVVFHADGQGGTYRLWLSRLLGVAEIGGTWNEKHECLRVDGGGMDMGYHLVECMSYALYGDGDSLLQDWV